MTDYGYAYETASTAASTNWKRGRDGRKVTGITIHHWGNDGSNFDGIVRYLCSARPANPTSAHYVAQGADANGTVRKRVSCIVDPDDTAYHAGNWPANLTTIGIECRPEARDVDYAVVAELVARLRSVYGDVPLYPHRHWTTTACPGRWDVERLDRLARAVDLKGTPAPVPGGGQSAPIPKPAPKPAPAPKPKPAPKPAPAKGFTPIKGQSGVFSNLLRPGTTASTSVYLYQLALRRYLNVYANRYNPSGATGNYGSETATMTGRVYLDLAKKAKKAGFANYGGWLNAEQVRTEKGLPTWPGGSLLKALGLRDLGHS